MLISVSTPRLACILVLCYELLLKSFAFTCVEYISGFIQKMVSLGILRSQMPSWFPVPLFPGCTCVKVTVVKIWSVLPELTIRQQANARDCMFWTFMQRCVVTAQVFEVHQTFEALCSKEGHTPSVWLSPPPSHLAPLQHTSQGSSFVFNAWEDHSVEGGDWGWVIIFPILFSIPEPVPFERRVHILALFW